MSPNEGHQLPIKRLRTSLACQNCRRWPILLSPFGLFLAVEHVGIRPLIRYSGLRKLSCNGSRPCARCRYSDQECTDADPPNRTPLTRKRMTELEKRYVCRELGIEVQSKLIHQNR